MFGFMTDYLLLWFHVFITGTIFLILANLLFHLAGPSLKKGGHLKETYLLLKLFLWGSTGALILSFMACLLRCFPSGLSGKLYFSGQEWLFGTGYQNLCMLACLIWLTGMLYHFREVYQRARMVGKICRICEVEGDRLILNEYYEIGRHLGLKRMPVLMYNEGHTDSFIHGLIHPVVVIPNRIMNKKLRRITMYHELLHYRSHDLFYRQLITLLNVVFWFLPGRNHLLDEAIELQETLVDLEVCRVMGQKEPMTSQTYYNEVLAYTTSKRSLSCEAVMAKLVENYCDLMKRIQNVLYVQNGKRRYTLVTAIASFSLILILSFMVVNLHRVDLFKQKNLEYVIVLDDQK